MLLILYAVYLLLTLSTLVYLHLRITTLLIENTVQHSLHRRSQSPFASGWGE